MDKLCHSFNDPTEIVNRPYIGRRLLHNLRKRTFQEVIDHFQQDTDANINVNSIIMFFGDPGDHGSTTGGHYITLKQFFNYDDDEVVLGNVVQTELTVVRPRDNKWVLHDSLGPYYDKGPFYGTPEELQNFVFADSHGRTVYLGQHRMLTTNARLEFTFQWPKFGHERDMAQRQALRNLYALLLREMQCQQLDSLFPEDFRYGFTKTELQATIDTQNSRLGAGEYVTPAMDDRLSVSLRQRRGPPQDG